MGSAPALPLIPRRRHPSDAIGALFYSLKWTGYTSSDSQGQADIGR